MAITVIIDPPLPTDAPSVFDQKAFAAWAAINGWAGQANALAEEMNEAAEAVQDPAVQEVVENIDAITAVNANKANIDAVAGNTANINSVAGNATNINTAAGNATSIGKVAAIDAAVSKVAAIDEDISTVAGIDEDVSAVAGVAAGVAAVAENIADVSTVSTNISDIQAAAVDMAAIKAAPAAASTASTKAEEASGHADSAEQAAEDAGEILLLVQAYGNGWTAELALVADGERRVIEILDWSGGQGTKPDTGYLGATGVVADIAEAADVRGAPGSGAVSSVNGVGPDGNGNVSLDTDDIDEGEGNLYFTAGRVRSTALTGLSTSSSSPVDATDSVLVGVGKLQAQIGDIGAILDEINGEVI